ncbi:maltose-binding protein/trehalose-binding protein/sucrose-binding protein [Gemmobacter aquatilis]|uniref:Maltose-binding protein/trehalose-binding protein/sucrose-binding protein n=1 Tax=Gemmobacter aquatilis TaxID=933059 RepID=A0A1H8GER8_9RHOB|nr:ABC transporter substrate-binding protein [Gemmobacter aquatilis]SEN42502.1 maltose-binding protein/trehalose-binding protein/sucrose-binding protein [Gemmobacter aquatilis]
MTRKLFASAAVLALLGGAAAAQDLKFAPGEDARFHWDSYEALKSVDLKGQTLTVLGPWLGPDKDLVESVIAYFEAATGATVNYSGSNSFEQQIVIDAEAGSPPDVAVFPQPGLAADLAAKGFLRPLGDDTAKWLTDNYAAGESWADLGTYPGKDGAKALYAFPYKADVKSLVWFVPENFEDAGYEVPETLEDLKALTEQIVADGGVPWCIGLGSGAATGWPATDWVEDLMLRINTPADYDAWVKNELKFDDPKVVAAIDEFGWFARNDAFVAGGAGAVASTDFRDSPKGLFASPPQCFMHHQASFIPSFFPEGTVIGQDADFFYFPAYASKDLGQPVLGAGTMFAVMSDNPAAKAFIDFLKTPIAHEVWMAQTGFVTPYKGVNTEVYGDVTLKKMGEILLGASTFRFDGSDLMPGAVGAGIFWTGMIDYTGGKEAAAVGAEIQKTWDTIK